MDKDIKRDYERYVTLCKKYGEKPKDIQKNNTWLEHYNDLLVKYNR